MKHCGEKSYNETHCPAEFRRRKQVYMDRGEEIQNKKIHHLVFKSVQFRSIKYNCIVVKQVTDFFNLKN